VAQKKFRIANVEISGFRGYKDSLTVGFGTPVVMFFGGNGSGKSSTLGAIEWCLFDEFASVAIDKRGSRDELLHEQYSKANVILEMTGPKKLKVTRSKKRNKKQAELNIELDEGPGEDIANPEHELYSNLNLGFDDFVRAVYLHQENVRGMLTDDPVARDKAMDRLFGLERLRNISDGLDLKKVKDAIKSLSARRQGALNKLQSHLDEASKAYEEAEMKAASFEIPKASVGLSLANKTFRKTLDSVSRISKSVGAECPEIPKPGSHGSLLNAAEVLRSSVGRIRRRLPGQEEISSLASALTKLNSLKSDLANLMTRQGVADRDIKSFEKEHGSHEKLTKDLNTTSGKMIRLEKERNETGSKERVILDGLEYLQEFAPARCPICGEKIDADDACQHLKEEVQEVGGEKLKQLKTRIAEMQEEEDQLESLLETCDDLEDRLEKAKSEVDDILEDVAKELGQPISSGKKGMELLGRKCTDLEAQRKKLEKPLKKREEELQEIELWLTQMEAIAVALRWKERRDEIVKLQKEKAFKRVDKTLKELGKLEAVVDMVAGAVQIVQSDFAKSLVDDAMPQIKKFYGELVGHPYYKDLQIEVTPKTTRGRVRNSYRIVGSNPKDGAETLAKDRFSTGQMNCVALSVFLALANKGAYSHNIGFLILDDPSQNLDTEHKEALCRILARVAKKSQLVISSQDSEFQKMLKSTFKDAKAITYRFGKWSINGPKIKAV